MIVITRENYIDLMRLAPTTMTAKARKLLRAIAQRGGVGDLVTLRSEDDYPLGYAANDKEFEFLFQALCNMRFVKDSSTLSDPQGALTFDGWVEAERHTVTQADKAFVAMWFKPEMSVIFRDAIAPACDSVGYRAVKVDDVEHVGKIDDRIIAEIKESRFIIADFTGHRGGVYFEAGYALGLGLPVIWTCRQDEVEKLHFDIRQYNCIVWDHADGLKDRLANRIRAAIGARADLIKSK